MARDWTLGSLDFGSDSDVNMTAVGRALPFPGFEVVADMLVSLVPFFRFLAMRLTVPSRMDSRNSVDAEGGAAAALRHAVDSAVKGLLTLSLRHIFTRCSFL
jgi:hypothetical protein